MTRSVSKQAKSQVVTGVNGATQSADIQLSSRINPASPIEGFRRHTSFSSFSTPDISHPDINVSKETVREECNISNVHVKSLSDEECDAIDNHFHNSDDDDCHPSCCFAGLKADGNHDLYKCLKCSLKEPFGLYVCEPCIDGGGHAPHRKYLELSILKK